MSNCALILAIVEGITLIIILKGTSSIILLLLVVVVVVLFVTDSSIGKQALTSAATITTFSSSLTPIIVLKTAFLFFKLYLWDTKNSPVGIVYINLV